MDKIQKALSKLSDKERKQVKDTLARLNSGNILGLDIQKLKGYKDIFRVRKGDVRIIYQKLERGIFILAIEHRSEKTYQGF